MHFVVAPDSFKGTIDARRVCEIMKEEILHRFSGVDVFALPMADGGEGTVDAFLQAGADGTYKTERVTCSVMGPFGRPVEASYAILHGEEGGLTAVIETASCAGLPIAYQLGKPDPSVTTTFGVGEQIADAMNRGCRRIIVGLGGSATNDAACGAAAALGVRFLDGGGKAFVPTGGTLSRIMSVSTEQCNPLLRQTEILCMCDIDNPLFGPRGAAVVFGPQKGADEAMVNQLDQGLRALARLLDNGNETLEGAGAAGGMGYGLVSFLGARLQSGIETVLDQMNFDTAARGAACIFTGEGRFDSQSVHGKVVSGIGKRAKALDVPVMVVAGCTKNDVTPEELSANNIVGVFATGSGNLPFEVIRRDAEENLRKTMREILAFAHPDDV